jgi:hypothetical protein
MEERKMTERTDEWRTIFNELIDDDGRYEMGRVNLYKLTSHLEELYLKIAELEAKVND